MAKSHQGRTNQNAQIYFNKLQTHHSFYNKISTVKVNNIIVSERF